MKFRLFMYAIKVCGGWGGVAVELHSFLTLALDEDESSDSRLGRSRESASTLPLLIE